MSTDLQITDLGHIEGPYRFYLVTRGTQETHVRVWTEVEGTGDTFVATTIGGPSKVTSGQYNNDTDAVRAHFRDGTDAQTEALARGINDGWIAAQGTDNALASIWTDARHFAERGYRNGLIGGEDAAACRAAYVGGWAIGVQRYLDGLRADGTPLQ
jgi:hypothetical protein